MEKVAKIKIEVYDDGARYVTRNDSQGSTRAAIAGLVSVLAALMACSMKDGVTPEELAEDVKETMLSLMKQRLEAAQRQGGPV